MQQSALHLGFWLQELSLSVHPQQAAHAYFGISRGLRFLPRGHRREATISTNYYKHEHALVVDKEFDRLLHAGFVAPVQDFTPCDVLAVGCVVKSCGKVRCVVNASGPLGSSINDDITEAAVTFPGWPRGKNVKKANAFLRHGPRVGFL
eukprot:SAG31_NODE_3388_length_4329_cov_5.938298_1_plen_149_part_00